MEQQGEDVFGEPAFGDAAVLTVQECHARATVGGEEIALQAGDIVVVNANEPHAFTDTSEGQLKQIDIHLSPHFVTDWLER